VSVVPAYPGVFVEEIDVGPTAIDGVSTSTAAFVDRFDGGPVNAPVEVHSFAEFARAFGSHAHSRAAYAVEHFFLNGGRAAWVVRTEAPEQIRVAISSLDRVPLFNTLCLPWMAREREAEQAWLPELVAATAEYCERRRAILLLDPPCDMADAHRLERWLRRVGALGRPNVAVYFPHLRVEAPSGDHDIGASGAVAGIYARVDAALGVWQAPAGEDAALRGIAGLEAVVSDTDARALASLGVNVLRTVDDRHVVGSALTLAADSEWKYLPVRRTALFLEESLYRGTSWAVFEPNDDPLWARIRTDVEQFLGELFRRGAFKGERPSDAYFVECKPTPAATDSLGIVEIAVGFAPLRPAEFVVIKIQQLAGAYPNFRYRIKWRGRYVAGVAEAIALDGRKSPYEPVTLERGVTHDPDFEQWASQGAFAPASDVRIDVHDEAGGFVRAYAVHRCRPSEYQALPELDANANAVAIQHLKLVHVPQRVRKHAPQP